MASKKITELLALTQATPDDLLPIVDNPSGTPITKKITISNFFGNVQPTVVFANSVTFRTTSQFNDDVVLLHSLAVNGTVTFTNTLSTTGNVIFGNTLAVTGNVVIGGNATVDHITANGQSQFNNGLRAGANDAYVGDLGIRIGSYTGDFCVMRSNGTINATSNVAVGGNVVLSTSNLSIGNTTSNASVNSTSITLNGNVAIYAGSATTRNAVRTQVGTSGANGSIYLSTVGKMYLKVNIAGADTDWQKVTTTAAD